MIFWALIKGTIKEALSKKILLSVFGLFSFIVLLILALINLDSVEGIPALMQANEEFDYRQFIISIELLMISQPPFLIIMTLFMVMVSSFIPSMLEKGNIEVLLSKPVSRTSIILSKYLAGVIIIFFALLYLVLLIWIIVSAKSGVWHFDFVIYSVIYYTYIFAVMYSAIILTGLLFRSTILSLIVNIMLFFPITAILSLKNEMAQVITNKPVMFIIDFIYYLLPKPWDIRAIASSLIEGSFTATGGFFFAYQPVITSGIFMVAMLFLSIYFFNKKDY